MFDSLIQSKLRYATASAWLLKSDMRRLDGFQASCLRRILGIPCYFISRVSNEKVRSESGMTQFSKSVLKSQLRLLGQVLNDPRKHSLKEVTFHGQTDVTQTAAFVRRTGRPRQNWADQLTHKMKQAAGSLNMWAQAAGSAKIWKEVASRVVL